MQTSPTSPLIGVAELASRLDEVVLLDVRWRLGGPPGQPEFLSGHIPGAAYVDLPTVLASAPGPRGRHPLPEPGVLEAALRAAGVQQDRGVVVYDDWAGRAAARAWWLLRWTGHQDVRVLDGGWAAWQAAGQPVATGPEHRPVGDVTVRPGGMPVLAVDDVLEHVRSGTLVDAREPERFRGAVEPVDPVAGHIPGATNVPTTANLRADGTFRPADELRRVYAGADGAVAAYCGSGVTAAHAVLAMEVAGISAALYPGSWSEWVTDESRPVERSA